MLDFSAFSGRKDFLKFFEAISKIPRGSGNSSHIANYLEAFARERGLFCVRDSYNNVLIKKRASKGYENAPAVILQGHTDMVIATNEKLTGNILKDGVSLYIDGEFLRGVGSTLGADNGIAVAYMLAILDSDEKLPPIEALFTSDEEIGLIGAGGFDTSILSGKTLINIDAGYEGIFIAGCAGGEKIDIYSDFKAAAADSCYEISVSGLRGGHSGDKIHEGRLNAIKLMAELAKGADMIGNIKGGSADNAIANEVTFSVTGLDDIEKKIKDLLIKWEKTEKDIKVTAVKKEKKTSLIDKDGTKKLINLISSLPYGPTEMMKNKPSQVKTSANLGIISSDGGRVNLTASIRSSSDTSKAALEAHIISIADGIGARTECSGKYPGWEYKEISPLRDALNEAYTELYNKTASTVTIHAGLECGIFASAINGLDCVSLGPSMYDIHTANERLSIPSAIRGYEFLIKALSKLKG